MFHEGKTLLLRVRERLESRLFLVVFLCKYSQGFFDYILCIWWASGCLPSSECVPLEGFADPIWRAISDTGGAKAARWLQGFKTESLSPVWGCLQGVFSWRFLLFFLMSLFKMALTSGFIFGQRLQVLLLDDVLFPCFQFFFVHDW